MHDGPVRILLQTTIPPTEDDWSIARFSRLGALLTAAKAPSGDPMYEVTMRDRDPLGRPDGVLSKLDQSDYDELWLFAVDIGDGLTESDCEAISRFRRQGRGLLVTRDHMDLGSSICGLAGVGKAHHFHSRNVDPVVENCRIDDPYSTNISWPNYHSGANGDFQIVEPVLPLHPVLTDSESSDGYVQFLPTHPHEGAIAAPDDEDARVIARGKSQISGRVFNLAVAFEASNRSGRAIAQSTFHHFADYNWDTSSGCPSFVDEPPGDSLARTPTAVASTHRYMLNAAAWLAGRG
ncbi:MAG: hypothetical protein WDN02_02130 [Methylovirgula sp.]|uniref:hypothetical protein n=1 Tax=Methylovirgula sp. TaxID=1978224 RepID=UPI0030760DED